MPGDTKELRGNVALFEERIDYSFKDKALLKRALTHSSYANEQKINKTGDYERLEFLGDAILEFVSSDFLFSAYPDKKEGELTRLRSSMVCEVALAFCAKDIELDQYILLGKGEEATGGRKKPSIIADVMEAVIGAMYLDGGIEPAHRFIHSFILSDLQNKQLFYDSKSVLQEEVQKHCKENLSYEIIEETGPDHNKHFVMRAMLDDREIGVGEGQTKKAAEQMAAYNALLAKEKWKRS